MRGKVCVLPRVHGVGGMVSFLHKFSEGAAKQGVEVTQDPTDLSCQAMLVIGGTKDLLAIRRFKQNGRKVVQRLDGINWIHRLRPVSLKHTLRSEYGNWVISFIRKHLADEIIYQSGFSQDWWNKVYGEANKPSRVIYNGVNLEQYCPAAAPASPPYRLLVVEGSMGGGYDSGLENAVNLANALSQKGWKIELQVVGGVADNLREYWNGKALVPVLWTGQVRRDQIPEIDRGAHLLFSADIHPACPNAVLEALGCGLPVVAFDTGSLRELVGEDCGAVADYGADPWKLEKPNIGNLVEGAERVLKDWPLFSSAARTRAEELFGLDQMVNQYLEVLLG